MQMTFVKLPVCVYQCIIRKEFLHLLRRARSVRCVRMYTCVYVHVNACSVAPISCNYLQML